MSFTNKDINFTGGKINKNRNSYRDMSLKPKNVDKKKGLNRYFYPIPSN